MYLSWDKDCNLQTEISVVTVSLDEASKENDAALLDMICDTKSSCVLDSDCIVHQIEEDDSILMEGDMVLDNAFSVSGVCENSSICGDDLLVFEIGIPSSVEFRTKYGNIKIISNNFASEELANGYSGTLSNLSAQSHKEGASSEIIRSVLEIDCVPLWGFTSFCGRRSEMEDALATTPQFVKLPIDMLIEDQALEGSNNCLSHLTTHFFGVYDGHGGSQVADYCRDQMHLALLEELENKTIGTSKSNYHDRWKKVFANCFVKVDDEIGGKTGNKPVAPETVGSTAVVSLICSSHIIVANCGDSRAVLCRGKEPMALSVDHKPDQEDEYARIEAAGGKVIQWNGYRVFGVLAMSRSIGMHILAHSSPFKELMSLTILLVLSNRALQKGSKDNITVIVIDLKVLISPVNGCTRIDVVVAYADLEHCFAP